MAGREWLLHSCLSEAPQGQVPVTGLACQVAISGSEPANDQLLLNTLGGKDRVTVAPGVSGLIQPVVDLGTDQ